MTVLVIAPNKPQFDRFVHEEAERVFPHAVDFRYVSREDQLRGYRGEVIIVNADQIPNEKMRLFARVYDDRVITPRYVSLLRLR